MWFGHEQDSVKFRLRTYYSDYNLDGQMWCFFFFLVLIQTVAIRFSKFA